MKPIAISLLVCFLVGCQSGCMAQERTGNKQVIKWDGRLNHTIPVFMYYLQQDSVLYGELMNASEQGPVKIIGQKTGEGKYVIEEIGPDNVFAAIWDGTIARNEFNGNRLDTKTFRTQLFELAPKDIKAPKELSMEAKEIAGTYSYTYPSVGGKSRFSIKRINGRQVIFNLACEGKEPSPYKHIITDDTLDITDNTVLHLRNSNCNCEFPITFYNDFAIIKFNFDPEYCLWDNTRGMDGIYVKTSGEFTPLGK